MRDQILRERGLDRAAGIGSAVGRVDVVARPAAPGSVRHDRDRRRDVTVRDQLVERSLHPHPGAHRVAAAVQEVEHGIVLRRRLVARRQIDVVVDRLAERRRVEADARQAPLGDGAARADGRGREHDQQHGCAAREHRCEPVLHEFLPGVGRVDVPYEAAKAAICCAAPSMAASTNSPSPSVPAPAASSRSTVARARSSSSSVGRYACSMIGSCAGWIAARPRCPSSRPRAHERASPSSSSQVRVDGLRRPGQAGGDGRVDDPAARPVEPRLERAGLRAEVGLAERDPGDSRSARDRVRRLDARGRLDQAVHRQADRGHVLRPRDLRHDDAAETASAATASRSSASPALTRT